MPPAFEFRGNRDRRSQHNPRHEFTFRYSRPATSERPLLRTKREATPEQLKPVESDGQQEGLKFAPVSDMSDSEEADMDVSDDDDDNNKDQNNGDRDGDESHPRKKRALDTSADATPAPKWSNPDPYTVLPPPDENQARSKVDVVKLIRKSRVNPLGSQAAKPDAVTTNEDFISLGDMGGDDDDDDDDDDDRENGKTGGDAPENAPKGPRREMESAFGNRKRTHDDELKGFSKKTGKPMNRYYPDASILDEWRMQPGQTGAPWASLMPATKTLHPSTRLHNEIVSFFHWVKPTPYEQMVREDLVARLQSAFQKRYHGVQLRPFGSFASGMYLPTADIDMVLLSSNFMRKGIKTFGERKGQIYAYAAFIRGTDIPVPGSIETIAHARVPILKFVDKLTGLKVDLSFDNDSGLVANHTFHQWKAEYPAMLPIVAIVKQFLLLRGLNEVVTGGLGGLSITCLVTSLLQHLPHGHLEPNLGSVLMDFFNFYGNNLEFEKVGIRLNPPGFFNKRVYNDNGRLTIEDPNNPDNDISGGSREVALVFQSFADAFRRLKERMVSILTGQSRTSILDTIIAANYDEYTEQRDQLREVFEHHPQFAHLQSPPPPPTQPPPPPSQPPLPPGPPPGPPPGQPVASGPPSQDGSSAESSDKKLPKAVRKQIAGRERAARLKRLRPDIRYVPQSVSNERALTLGGYQTQSEMDRDLMARERP